MWCRGSRTCSRRPTRMRTRVTRQRARAAADAPVLARQGIDAQPSRTSSTSDHSSHRSSRRSVSSRSASRADRRSAQARARRADVHTTPRPHPGSIPPIGAGVLQLPGGSAHPYRRRFRGLQRRSFRPRRPGRAGRRDVGPAPADRSGVLSPRTNRGPGSAGWATGSNRRSPTRLAGDPAAGRAVRLRAEVVVGARRVRLGPRAARHHLGWAGARAAGPARRPGQPRGR